ncbi:integrase [Photobacterium rosenbergii]|uniref:Integrase n=1 Tax=Photobacterium rosenbergii TaxID=294936 RepID=A0A2T3MYX1_9GAMM|nr:integrase [Photobacterium rosenbergii]
MPRKTFALTNTQIKAAKPKDKVYLLSDGDGLQLRVKPNGSKSWQLNYYRPNDKKRTTISFGIYPTVTLAEARKRKDEAKVLIDKGIDPKQQRETVAVTLERKESSIMKNVAAKWFEVKKKSVTADYADDIWRSLEMHAFPTVGDMCIDDVTAPIMIDALKPLEGKGSLEQVKRVCQRMNEIMDFAVNTGVIDHNRLSGIRAAFQSPKKNNMPSIEPKNLPEFMKALSYANIKIVTRCLIEWQMHTMTRPGEAACMTWNELDLENNLWHIPAERMKKKIAHTVPLTNQAIEILERIKPVSGHREHVFPADRNPKTHTNTQTANMAIKRMDGGKYKGVLVAHGLRSIASTALNDSGEFEPDLIEKALAHLDKNEVRRAYNRGDYLERRKKVMEWWSDYIDAASNSTCLG